ncbi:molybdate ABC transporter substrate-binding protein [Neobacillus sp. K501]
MRKYSLIGTVFIVLLSISGCTKNESQTVELTISAAASLHDALTEIKGNFEKDHKEITLHINIGGSGALKQQILQGAPADLYLSAAQDHFSELTQKGLIEADKQVELLSNKLVLITNKNNTKSLVNLVDLKMDKINKIAIGIPESVPAGMYAKQTLQNIAIWEIVEPKLVQTKDVRQVLAYVETENVDAGLVYQTDAMASSKIKIVATANEQNHDPIIYPAGIIKNSKHQKEALLFFDYLQSESAKSIFKKFGFTVLD